MEIAESAYIENKGKRTTSNSRFGKDGGRMLVSEITDRAGRQLTGMSVMGKEKRLSADTAARGIFLLCALISVLAVGAIALYIIVSGTPALGKAGLKEMLFGTVWRPAASEPRFGILYMILTSAIGTLLAVFIGMPIGVLTAVFLVEISGAGAAGAVRAAVELLAGIPSVIYGLLGSYLLNPLMYKLERWLFAGSPSHQFTGGANLLSASLVLAVMILPTVISVSETAIRRVSADIRAVSFALGATRVQTIFRVILPAARSGIVTAGILGLGRAMGEATAILLVAGNSVNLPLPFRSVRFLTTTVVSEMGYAQGVHRQALFAIGLVLFLFIMLVNMLINKKIQEGG